MLSTVKNMYHTTNFLFKVILIFLFIFTSCCPPSDADDFSQMTVSREWLSPLVYLDTFDSEKLAAFFNGVPNIDKATRDGKLHGARLVIHSEDRETGVSLTCMEGIGQRIDFNLFLLLNAGEIKTILQDCEISYSVDNGPKEKEAWQFMGGVLMSQSQKLSLAWPSPIHILQMMQDAKKLEIDFYFKEDNSKISKTYDILLFKEWQTKLHSLCNFKPQPVNYGGKDGRLYM